MVKFYDIYDIPSLITIMKFYDIYELQNSKTLMKFHNFHCPKNTKDSIVQKNLKPLKAFF